MSCLSRVSRICLWFLLCIILLNHSSHAASSVEVSQLYNNLSIPVIPYLYDSQVLFQDVIDQTYRLVLLHTETRDTVRVRNNLVDYLYPLAFGGSHAGWIYYDRGGSIALQPGGSDVLSRSLYNTATYHLKMMSITGARTETTVSTTDHYKEHLAVDGDRVAWTDYRFFDDVTKTTEVFFRSLSSGSETRITSQSGYKAAIALHGDYIVWQDYRDAAGGQNADIYLYDLRSLTQRAICRQTDYQNEPSMQGRYVVWQDYRNAGSGENADIYGYDMVTGQEFPVSRYQAYQSSPQVYGSVVVWEDYRNVRPGTVDSNNVDIYLYDIAAGTELPVTTRAGYQGFVQIYGQIITWYDGSDTSLYQATISGANGIRISTPRSVHTAGGSVANGGAYTIDGRRAETPSVQERSPGGMRVDKRGPAIVLR